VIAISVKSALLGWIKRLTTLSGPYSAFTHKGGQGEAAMPL
jgi:hypothetical protein